MRAMFSRRGLVSAPYRKAIRNVDNEMTNLALMLSDQCPWCTEIRYMGEHRTTVDGPVLRQPDAVQRAVGMIRRSETENGGFPAMEFEEVMLNAVTHRSYCDPSPVVVDIRDRFTVVTSPGGMMRIGHGFDGRTRNPGLASIADSMGLKSARIRGIGGIIGAYRGC